MSEFKRRKEILELPLSGRYRQLLTQYQKFIKDR
jgi:hypothetical protein